MNEKDIILLLANRYLKMLGFNRDQHLRNMCLTIIDKIDSMPEGKANRWLGYIQKSVIDMKLSTIPKERKIVENFYISNNIHSNFSSEEHF
jgi:hypothetical protein